MSQHPERIGRYQIIKPLGSGAMGDVFLARDPNIGRQLAIKTVRVIGGNADDIQERKSRLLREARAAGQFLHPNAVALFDADEADGVLYLAFEFVDGQDLAQRLRKTPELTLGEALKIVRETAGALAYAHKNEIVHRDIKPSNILIGPKGEAKVADFGIAKLTNQSVELTRTGSVVGSPQYMSPEQIRGENLDGRSDLFSLGVVLYEMLSRSRPFGGDTISTLVFEILSKEPPPIESLRPGLPQRLLSLVRGMLAKDRNHRISSAAQVVAEIENLERELAGADLERPAAFQASEHQPTMMMTSSSGAQAATAAGPPSPPPFSPPAPYPLPAPPTPPQASYGYQPQASSAPPPYAGYGPPPAVPPTAPPYGQGPTGTAVQPNPAYAAPVQPPYAPAAPGYGPPQMNRPKPNSGGKILLFLVLFSLLGLGVVVALLYKMGMDGKDKPNPATIAESSEDTPATEEAAPPATDEVESTPEPEPPRARVEPPPVVERVREQIEERPVTRQPTEDAPLAPPVSRREPERPKGEEPGGVLGRLGEAARNASAGTGEPTERDPSDLPQADEKPSKPATNDAWAEAAKNAHREIESGRRFQFKVTPPETKVLFWQPGDRRAIVQGAAGEFDPKRDEDTRTLELPGDGDYLIILRQAGMPDHVILAHAASSRGQAPKLIQVTMGSATRVSDGNGATPTLKVGRSVSFGGTPADAVVVVDGKRRGFASEWPGGARARSDDNLKLERGRRVIRLEAPGYQPQEFIVIVGPGGPPTEQISYRLTREP